MKEDGFIEVAKRGRQCQQAKKGRQIEQSVIIEYKKINEEMDSSRGWLRVLGGFSRSGGEG